jgi:RiboL-PSP-HEPN
MNNLDLIKQHQKLIKLINDTELSTHGDLELQGHWGKYLCVLVSGFLENAISAVYIDFVSKAASPHIAKYTLNHLEKIQNPKSKKFVEVASQFKKEWGSDLDKYFSDHPEYKQAIDSIMTNRHLVAHGKNTSISVHRVRECLEKSVYVIEFIENQCSNRTVTVRSQ